MRLQNGAGPALCGYRGEARKIVGTGERDGQSNKPAENRTQAIHVLTRGRSTTPIVEIVADCSWRGLFRIVWPGGDLSAPASLPRCKDAALAWAEADHIQKNRRQRALKSLANFSWSSSPVRLNWTSAIKLPPTENNGLLAFVDRP
jgi:hypothetical protein